ncbi:electron transport complex protein RnfB [Psychrobacter sp. PL15]|jgi:electron transport complex protein RnfB|uniref:RnfABCDGE type electron transport complex subunit B n=1 Tax=unclassified Psychrobacter TaxID=196806 RepID=UPI001AE1BB1C|nr:RnfABCDGE type electron transport complex subunit B [Psychrobacter sp. PL15]MEC5209162.1 electron transport complex protein RnfB [Psychrobacter sp. PL15]
MPSTIHATTHTRLANLPILFNTLSIETLPAEIQAKIVQVDACLPQTQCGLCDHPDGCLPYATAIVIDGEPYNKCVPGGQPVSDAIGNIVKQKTVIKDSIAKSHATKSPVAINSVAYDPSVPNPTDSLTAVPSKWPIDALTERPREVRAVIREDDCIGCTKCIPACPVDAIVGTGKHMHTIFTDLCTGCELCIAPCPVDCIDLVTIERPLPTSERVQEQDDLRQRYHNHLRRVTEQLADSSNSRPVVSMVEAKLNNATTQTLDISEQQAKDTIAAAKLRSKIKKLEKQLSVRENSSKQAELEALQAQLSQL